MRDRQVEPPGIYRERLLSQVVEIIDSLPDDMLADFVESAYDTLHVMQSRRAINEGEVL